VGVGITGDHLAVAEVATSFAQSARLRALTRDALDKGDLPADELAKRFAELGWTGIHLPERVGGSGADLLSLAVVLEALGREVAPDVLLATVGASAVLAASESAEDSGELLARLAEGTVTGGVAVAADVTLNGDRAVGTLHTVLGGAWADLVVVRASDDLLAIDTAAPGVTVEVAESLDPSSGIARVRLAGVEPRLVVRGEGWRVRQTMRTLCAAVAAGGARGALDSALAYAKIRRQFGRTIGSFQAIKHDLADMLVNAERAAAVAWDAARASAEDRSQAELAAAAAACVAQAAFVDNAQRCIQIHGGIGFTWEHDAHLYLRKAHSLAEFLGGTSLASDDMFTLGVAGERRDYRVDLPPDAAAYRSQARAFMTEYLAAPEPARRQLAASRGYLVPHWPRPWGRGAGPVEQLVLEEELAPLDLPRLGIGGWVLRTITEHGNAGQVTRWLDPSLIGDLVWCQLFSEPEAGSDAAAVRTRAVRVGGGWSVTGQKVWTSGAQSCNRGLATVRTRSDVPKHKGITTMVIDLHAPGVTVRPLREITGEEFFNEVFLDDVFVPHADVVGKVDEGWAVARATLGNERVSIGGEMPSRMLATDLLDVIAGEPPESGWGREIGSLIADEHALKALNLRQIERAVSGGDPGAEGGIAKVAKAEHTQRVTELAMRICGAAAVDGRRAGTAWTYLMCRALTIAGGTSEISRNIIAERLLGLPRDPLNV
jgi:alkylation response protein AidB-like acyl-CoA dehydrogenase